jgi:hypothetical protein
VHIPLRRRQILMPLEFLNRLGRSPTHRQVRAERVTKRMDTGNPAASRRLFDDPLYSALCQRPTLGVDQDPFTPQMPSFAQSLRQPLGQWNVSDLAALWWGQVTPSIRIRRPCPAASTKRS